MELCDDLEPEDVVGTLQDLPADVAAQVLSRLATRNEAEEDMKTMSGVLVDTRPDKSVGRIGRGRLP